MLGGIPLVEPEYVELHDSQYVKLISAGYTTAVLDRLDQSQIYLLRIPQIWELVTTKHLSLAELTQDKNLCFVRLKKYLAHPEILRVFT